MLSANTIIPITQYNAIFDSVVAVYEIPVGINSGSLLDPKVGTSDNSYVTIVKSGLQTEIQALENKGILSFLASANTATTVGIELVGGAVSLDLAAAGDAVQGDSTPITNGLSTVITDEELTGVILPTITPLSICHIYNKGTEALNVYPAVDDFINGYDQDEAVVVAVGAKISLYAKASAIAATENYGWNIL